MNPSSNFLDEIIVRKRARLASARAERSQEIVRAHASEVRRKLQPHALRSALKADGRLKIIAEIKRLNLYRMKDGSFPESQQIHARATHYPQLFG
jgi:indole-3-glycerol phosphate synthase